jgi:adenosylmethionine-8-amino-7-oxononanoate aminotransferase
VGPFIFIDLLGPDGATAPMETKRLVQHQAERRGVLIDYTPDVVMLVPPLVMEDAEADLLCDTVAEVLWELKEAEHDVAGLRPPSASGRR